MLLFTDFSLTYFVFATCGSNGGGVCDVCGSSGGGGDVCGGCNDGWNYDVCGGGSSVCDAYRRTHD